ncbi:conserved unknown protein [Ectocarpus siliculosus]|uniref:MaoC-like domain-containing protein n=1 Tax=Ectocarpus siliculosus TaxID=2880 RepID=D7FKH2_ECTSI|nr:conserved unknown protein [Ectocarpus siliculosus]|eukprot:CBJ29374.1 conserved unknown protein [Ectocarpus siliculosus]
MLRLGRSLGQRRRLSFYTAEYVEGDTTHKSGRVLGRVLEHAVNVKRLRPGDTIRIPYEVTVGYGLRDFWQAAFSTHDRINTSTPFARSLGLQDQVLPFSLMLFLSSSMSHVEAAMTQVAYRNARYLWPGFAGDTFTKAFEIKGIRNTSDKERSTYDFTCRLVNQRGKVCMECDRTTMFPFFAPPSPRDSTATPEEQPPPKPADRLRDHVVKQSEKLAELGGQTLRRFSAGQLIIHTPARPISRTQSMELSSLARLTHSRHFDTVKHGEDGLAIPAGLIVALATSLSARDLHEVLHEELMYANFINPFRPGDAMTSITYVQRVEQHPNGVLEKLRVRTIGIKDILTDDLTGMPLPLELFVDEGLRTKGVEQICRESCPELCGKIVVLAEREVIRQAPKTDVFLL